MRLAPWTPKTPVEHSHARLLSLFRSLSEAVCRSDWIRSLECHERLIIAFDVHMRHEEERWFPRYALLSPAAAGEVEIFVAQHQRLRQLLGGLSAAIREQSCDLDTLTSFELAWMAHDGAEGRNFDAWTRGR